MSAACRRTSPSHPVAAQRLALIARIAGVCRATGRFADKQLGDFPMANPKDKSPQNGRVLDRTDRRILTRIQANGRLTNKQLAELVNLSPTPCLRRVNLLEQAGYIERYRAVLRPAKLGYTIRAFLTIKRTRESHRETVWQRMLAIPEVIACHVVSGDFDLLVEVVARDMEHYANLTLKTITSIDGVHDLRSTFSIQALKTDGDLPIVEADKPRS